MVGMQQCNSILGRTFAPVYHYMLIPPAILGKIRKSNTSTKRRFRVLYGRNWKTTTTHQPSQRDNTAISLEMKATYRSHSYPEKTTCLLLDLIVWHRRANKTNEMEREPDGGTETQRYQIQLQRSDTGLDSTLTSSKLHPISLLFRSSSVKRVSRAT